MSELDKAIEKLKGNRDYKDIISYAQSINTIVSTIDQLRDTVNKDEEYYTEQVKRFEEMRRNTTSEFCKQSHQTWIHKLNAKREYLKIIKEIIGG